MGKEGREGEKEWKKGIKMSGTPLQLWIIQREYQVPLLLLPGNYKSGGKGGDREFLGVQIFIFEVFRKKGEKKLWGFT